MTVSDDPTVPTNLYRVCGLVLSCNASLPELAHAASSVEPNETVDVRVELFGRRLPCPPSAQWFMNWRPPSGDLWLSVAKIAGGYLLRFPDLADFTVDRAGRKIVCRPEPDTPSDTLRHLLLDQVVPLVLTLHGCHALHATSVKTQQGVCAFIGPTGVGKSTLAASFLFAGYPVLSDDCLVIQADDSGIVATPAYPGLRLWDDSLDAICEHHQLSIPVAHYTDKRRPVLGQYLASFPTAPHPLTRIYSLVRRDEADRAAASAPCIERLSRRDAFVELLASSHRLDTTDHAVLVRQFDFFERVVAEIPVCRLHLLTDFAALSASREAVLADLTNNACTSV